MHIDVKVPKLPESVADATVAAWHKKSGDFVESGETIVELETDKVILEVPAPESGTLADIIKTTGDTVVTGDILASIKQGTGKKTAEKPPAPLPQTFSEPEPAPLQTAHHKQAEHTSEKDLSPAVRHMVQVHNLNPENIIPTGKGGRITKEDVVKFLENRSSKPQFDLTAQQPAPNKSISPIVQPIVNASAEPVLHNRPVRRVPMTRLRARIAERLVQAQQSAALLTTFNEINMHAIIELRNRYKELFESTHSIKLGFMSFFVKAAVDALKRFPQINASIDETDIVYNGYYDIGIAVSTPRGLVVPILRDADTLNFAQIEKKVVEYSQKATAGTLSIDELTGGTFSITNGGVFGSMLSTPIVNPPQSAILGMHNIVQRPVAEGNEVVIRPMMYVALTYDHRIIDGKESVQFLKTIKEILEDPARLLLEL